ncbi:hypothetical protein [Nostoc sp. FACHB-110]|nr:hypothetical protein [Nostoc sp. FACHB-110]
MSRSAKYTRYLSDRTLLRTHTTTIMPELIPLPKLRENAPAKPERLAVR